MKKRKALLSIILVSALIGLSGCSLFNDDDIAIKNSYNPSISEPEEDPNAIKAGGVTGKEVEEVPNALCFKSISYATNEKILNSYKDGGINNGTHANMNVNRGEDYVSNKSGSNYDLYVPNSTPRNDKHIVLLFIHGGAWVSGFKTDVNPYVHEFARRGYITATIKYSLLKRTMDNPSLSIFRNLDEIDACIKSIKSSLEELNFDITKTELVIGGASSGAHLSMLYAYSRGEQSALPIKFVVDAVGPTDIKPDAWKCFKDPREDVLDGGLSKSAIEAQASASNLARLSIAGEKDEGGNPVYWNDYQTLRVANGMCGIPSSLEDIAATTDAAKEEILHPNAASHLMTDPDGGQDLLSVTYWIKEKHALNNYKIICAYAGQDSIVGVNQFATLQTKLDSVGIDYEYVYFKDSNHTEITAEKNPSSYNQFVTTIDNWCKA